MKEIIVKRTGALLLGVVLGFMVAACNKNDSGYEPAVKSECRPLILVQPAVANEEEASITDEVLFSDDDAEIMTEEKVTLVSKDSHRLVFLYTAIIQCGDDMVFSTKTEIDESDPATLLLYIKRVDTDSNSAVPCTCITDFTITRTDAEYDLSLVKKIHVFSPNGITEKTFDI